MTTLEASASRKSRRSFTIFDASPNTKSILQGLVIINNPSFLLPAVFPKQQYFTHPNQNMVSQTKIEYEFGGP